MTSQMATPLFAVFSSVGECPTWEAESGALLWTDIDAACLYRARPGQPGEIETLPMPDRVGAFGLRADGGLVLGTASGLVPDSRRPATKLPFPGQRQGVRLNDGKVDPFGNFICGGVVEAGDGSSGLFRLSPGGEIETLLTGIRCANGACFSPDGKWFYFTDTPTRRLLRFELRAFGEGLGAPELVTEFAEGTGWPDGAAVDEEGNIWVALWGAGRVVRLTPAGREIGEVRIPTSNTTCPAFGGPGGKLLFITSEGGKLSEAQRAAQPHAGHVFVAEMAVAGGPTWRFGQAGS